MMNTQELKSNAGTVEVLGDCLASGQVMTLGSAGGEVRIVFGRVWLTSPGDLSDHVLEAGESFRVTAGGPTLVEAWDPCAPVRIDWRPRTWLERARDGLVGSLVKPIASSASLLHNAAEVAVGATEMRGSLADGRDTRDRSSRPAQEAGRRAPGAA